jgi:uncharacterized protein involved in outer membrane biogenesis
VARVVSQAIGRTLVVEGGPRGQGREARPALHLWRGVSFTAPTVRVSAPTWSADPWLLSLTDGELRAGYGDLWRMSRGGPVTLQKVRAQQLQAWLRQDSLARSSWALGDTGASASERRSLLGSLRIDDLQVAQGLVHLRLALQAMDADVGLSVIQVPGTATWQLAAQAVGRYRGLPMSAQAHSVRPWALQNSLRLLDVSGTVGRARFAFQGQAMPPQASVSFKALGAFKLSGPSLSAAGEPLGVTLPTTAAFQMSGLVNLAGAIAQVNVSHAAIGDSRLAGEFRHDRSQRPSLLTGRLTGSRLALADLGPAVGVPKPEQASTPRPRVLPDKAFNLPSLKAMNADVDIAIDVFDSGSAVLQPMRDLRGHIDLHQGLLRLERLSTRLAAGSVKGLIELDARQGPPARLRADLDLDGVRIEQWVTVLRRDKQAPYLSGELSGGIDVTGRGQSVAQMLGSLDGVANLQLTQGEVSHLGIELAGLDLMQGLFEYFKGDESLKVQCAQLQLQARKGVLTPQPAIVSTRDSTLWADGQVSLRDETLDLRARVAPKDFTLVSLRTPLRVEGPWQGLQVHIVQPSTWARLLGAAVLSTVHPLAAIVPLIDPGQQDAARSADLRCRQAARARP